MNVKSVKAGEYTAPPVEHNTNYSNTYNWNFIKLCLLS